MKHTLKFLLAIIIFCQPLLSKAQTVDEDSKKKAVEWVTSLNIADKAKEQRITDAIATHLGAVKDWHNSHDFTLVPAGLNPATGNKLSDLDRQIIVCSSKPASIHKNLMTALYKDLDSAAVADVLDKYTVGKVAFTMKGYEAIVPNMTEKEKAEILKNLQQAREEAIDYKNMKEISAIFEIYKTKNEQYLNNNGRSWRQMYKDYTNKIKAQKEADKKNKKDDQ